MPSSRLKLSPRPYHPRVRRAYKFRVYPTERQEGRLAECLRDHRALYNAALEERRGRWKWNRQTVRYGDQSAQLKEIRSACPEQGRWSFSSQQATLRRLDKAMAAFFRRLKTGGKPGFPRFKGSDRFHRAGVPMALGTDVFTSGAGTVVPWGHNGEELTHLVAAGLSPLEAIEAATARAPLTLGPQAPRSGLLAEGYDADLIALAANPLDDITVLAEPANVTHVWKGGVPQKEAR